MTDRMKESVFSSLGDLSGLEVLDLYAGSGSLGLEALSRGAASALFVDNARDAIVSLEQNVETTGLGDRAEVVWADVNTTLARPADSRKDLIFVDPPYATTPDAVQGCLEALVMGGFLTGGGRIVLHRPARERRLQPLGLRISWDRTYGQSHVYVFVHDEEEED
jgi:16S rRNA (guanine966-N2)-methyltransferase